MRRTKPLGRVVAFVMLVLGLAQAARAQGTWTPTSTLGAPSARVYHKAVWTGSRMIVWGRQGSNVVGGQIGGRYDPVADVWAATSTAAAPAGRVWHSAVWTGTRMIVWGGSPEFTSSTSFNTGGIYDPVADAWTATATANAPSPRESHAAVWTGSKMIVWGGWRGGSFNTGGIYDPATNTWSTTSTVGAPSARDHHTAVWTGSRMLVWGGSEGVNTPSSGGSYDPATNTWTPTSVVGAPSGRIWHSAVWTGSKMIVWGGQDFSSGHLNTGGVYDPATDTWTATSTVGAPTARGEHTAVWTGSRMIVWGGTSPLTNSGGIYDPATDSWTATGGVAAPIARSSHTAVWTGSTMIVWGGQALPPTNTGGVYNTSPSLSIGDVSVAEPDPGPSLAVLTVTLSPASGQSVTVDYATADGTATVPADYLVASGTLTFAPGETTKQVSVTVNGDALDELDETFFVNLTNPTNAAIADGQGLGTINQPVKFHTSTPCRILDTRNPNGPLGGPILSPGQQRSFTVTGGACVVPGTAKALSVNLTVVGPTAAGFVTVFPGDGSLPPTSSINFSAGQVRANNGVFRLAGDASGRINIVNGSSGSTHVLLDVNGYFE